MTAEATGKWGQAYGIVADGEGSSSVKMGDGNIKAQATTTGETEGAYASGILVDPGYTVSKNDGSINVTATALNGGKEAYASGVNNIGGTVTLGDTDFIVTATADNANAWASGLDNRSGPLSMGNGTMIVTASGEDKINAAYGIRAWSDSKEVSTGLVNITAKTVGGNTTDDYVEAISVLAQSGKISMEGGSLTALSDKGIAYGLHATNTDSITFGSTESTASIYARSQADSAMGIYLNDSSLQKGVGDIVVESVASRADGVFITDSSKANLGSGLISVSGAKASTAISALGESDVILNGGMLNAISSAGRAYGIWVDNSTISSAENSSPLDIKVASLDSDNVSEAIGVLALSGADVNLGNGNIDAKADNSVQAIGIFADGSHVTKGSGTISAHSEGGKVFGVYAEAAEMTLGAAGETLTIAASGNDNAVGIAVRDNTTLTLAGHTDIVAPVALEGWNGSVINRGNLTTEGTVSGFTGSYVQTSGSTWLGEQSGFFSGDVEIQGGTLVAGLDTLGNLQPDGNQALLALGSSVNLTSGNRLLVGSVDDTNTAAVAFGANSMLVVDGKSDSNGAFISASDGDVAVDEKSTLYIVNAQAGAEYTITDGLNVNDGQSWSHENLLGNRLADMVVDSTDDSIVVSVSAKEAALAMPDVVSPAALNSMMMGKQNDIDSSSLGIRFLSRATDQRIFSSDALAVATINEVSRAAVTAGVQNTALRLAEAGTDQLIHHLSLSFFDKGNSIHKDGLDVWATPMYGNTYSHGLDASGTSVRGNYGGLSLGADIQAGEILGGRYVWARPCTVEEVSPKRKVRPRIRKIPTASAE